MALSVASVVSIVMSVAVPDPSFLLFGPLEIRAQFPCWHRLRSDWTSALLDDADFMAHALLVPQSHYARLTVARVVPERHLCSPREPRIERRCCAESLGAREAESRRAERRAHG